MWTRVVIAHLGNGASMAAIHHDRSVDTSMGMTPLEGLVMGSRCGDVDPGVIVFLQHLGLSIDDVEHTLNSESGLLGLSGFSNDVRDLQRRADRGDYRARLALDVSPTESRNTSGAYAASQDSTSWPSPAASARTARRSEPPHVRVWDSLASTWTPTPMRVMPWRSATSPARPRSSVCRRAHGRGTAHRRGDYRLGVPKSDRLRCVSSSS